MTFQLKSYTFINHAIKRVVEHIKANAKKQCFFVNLKNATFWKKTPRGDEIVIFFKEMNDNQIIQFFGFFDIFFVGYHNGNNGFISMTANPSNPKFEHTVFISISNGYKWFSHYFSGRATSSIEGDLRSLIGSTPVQHDCFSTSPAGFQDSSMESAFQEGLSTFGAGPATQAVSQQFQGFGGPTSGFSLFSAKPPSIGGYFQPIAQGGSTNPFTLQADFIQVEPTNEPLHRGEKLKIMKGRVIREIEIPSGFSSGPSTSSTVGIAKSPKAKTPVATTIANLEKKVARLERENPTEGSSDYLTLVISQAKLEKLRN